MSGGPGLEQRYRRVLRLLPGYYRDMWEEDMVAAFLDSWLTGDPYDDDAILEFCKPTWEETASVAGLAARLYLGGTGAPHRYVVRGQAVRNTVLVLTLLHAAGALNVFVRLAWTHRLFGWLPAPPATIPTAPSGGIWATTLYAVQYAWIVIFLLLALGHQRTARVIAALVIIPDLVAMLQAQLDGSLQLPYGAWAFWVLLDLAPVLAMAAFDRDAPPTAGQPWLLALPACYLLVYVPVLAIQATGNSAWLPDFSGLCCLLVTLACLAHAPRVWSRQGARPGVWSLTLTLLAAVAVAYRIVSLGDYRHDPHLMAVSLAELLILAAAVALVAPDAARARTAATSAAGITPRRPT